MTLERDTRTGLHLPQGIKNKDVVKDTERWQCRRGHVLSAPEPYKMEMLINGKIVHQTRPLCPRCFGEWLEKQFRADKVSTLPQDTVSKQRRRRQK